MPSPLRIGSSASANSTDPGPTVALVQSAGSRDTCATRLPNAKYAFPEIRGGAGQQKHRRVPARIVSSQLSVRLVCDEMRCVELLLLGWVPSRHLELVCPVLTLSLRDERKLSRCR